MVHRERRDPQICAVAVLAYVCRLNVSRIFAGSINAVMAAETIPHDIHVIEVRRYPGGGGVAVIAIVPAGDMTGMLADSSNSVMTSKAVTQYVHVVDGKCWCPYIRGMAVLTNIGRLNMIRRFAS